MSNTITPELYLEMHVVPKDDSDKYDELIQSIRAAEEYLRFCVEDIVTSKAVKGEGSDTCTVRPGARS